MLTTDAFWSPFDEDSLLLTRSGVSSETLTQTGVDLWSWTMTHVVDAGLVMRSRVHDAMASGKLRVLQNKTLLSGVHKVLSFTPWWIVRRTGWVVFTTWLPVVPYCPTRCELFRLRFHLSKKVVCLEHVFRTVFRTIRFQDLQGSYKTW